MNSTSVHVLMYGQQSASWKQRWFRYLEAIKIYQFIYYLQEKGMTDISINVEVINVEFSKNYDPARCEIKYCLACIPCSPHLADFCIHDNTNHIFVYQTPLYICKKSL